MSDIDLLGDVIVDPATAVPGPLPPAETRYLVATWYAPWPSWKIWKETSYSDKQAAKEVGVRICSNTRGHTHYTVIEVHLPGVE